MPANNLSGNSCFLLNADGLMQAYQKLVALGATPSLRNDGGGDSKTVTFTPGIIDATRHV